MDPHAWGNEPVGAAGCRMDPHAWDNGLPRLQRNLDPYQQSGVNNRTGHSSNCDYMRYSVDEPRSSSRVNVGWKEPGPPSHNFHTKGSEVEDPDGEPLEMDEEDPELARKRQKLREIEQQIMHKRVSIALKTVEPIMKNTTSPTGLSCNEQSATSAGATLRDRVNVILQQRKSLGFLAKSSQERRNSSRLRAGGLLLEDHPLKLRVKALMRQRCLEMPGVPPLPPSPSVPSPVQEESSSNKGFQCFLSLLNKGVDMDMLSRIVNDDSEDLPSGEEQLNLQSPVEERNPHLPFRNQKQRLTSDPLSPEKSHCSSRSTSSPAEKEKKEEAAVESKADEQREQLQNVLKSLGLSLEVEEMNRLSDRTRERLYGKKQEVSQRADSREEQQESRPRDSHQPPGRPSASSSCSSYSPSRPTSRSPSRLPHSHEGELSNKKTSPLQQQVSPSPDHPGYSAYSGYSVAQYSQHTVAYHRDESYYWTQTPLHPSGFPYTHNTYSHFPGPAAPPNTVYPHNRPYKVANLSMDSDLCQSEGQSGSSSGPRCLQVIDTKGSNNQSWLKLFTMSHIGMMKLKSQNPPHRPTPLSKNRHNQRGSQQLTMGPKKKKKKKKKKKSQNHPQGSAPLPMNPNPSQSGSSSGPRCLQVADTEEPNDQSGSKQPTKQKKKVMGSFKRQIQYNLDGAAPLSMNQSGAFSHLRCLLVVAETQQTNDQSDSTQPKKKRKKRKKKKNCSLQPQNLRTAKGKRPRIVKTARDEFSLQRQEDDLHGDLDGELWEKEEPQPTVTKTTETATRRSIRLFMKNKREEERRQQLTAGETGVDVVEAQRSEEEKQKHTDLSEDSMKKLEAPQATKQDSGAEKEPEEEKRPPTEEEMKANLSTKPGVNDVTNQSPAVPEEK